MKAPSFAGSGARWRTLRAYPRTCSIWTAGRANALQKMKRPPGNRGRLDRRDEQPALKNPAALRPRSLVQSAATARVAGVSARTPLTCGRPGRRGKPRRRGSCNNDTLVVARHRSEADGALRIYSIDSDSGSKVSLSHGKRTRRNRATLTGN